MSRDTTTMRNVLSLCAETAAEMMRENPVSIREDASILEAVALLTDKGFSAAPVIDKAGRPVGVLSRSDILIHDREKVEYVSSTPDYYHDELATRDGESLRKGFQIQDVDRTSVGDIMTPAVFSVTPDTPATQVVQQLLALKVHRMFVVDESGVMIGVISTLDVLRNLR